MGFFRRIRLTQELTRYAQGRGDLPPEIAEAAASDPDLAELIDGIGPHVMDGAKGAVPWATILQIIMAIIEIISGGKSE